MLFKIQESNNCQTYKSFYITVSLQMLMQAKNTNSFKNGYICGWHTLSNIKKT